MKGRANQENTKDAPVDLVRTRWPEDSSEILLRPSEILLRFFLEEWNRMFDMCKMHVYTRGTEKTLVLNFAIKRPEKFLRNLRNLRNDADHANGQEPTEVDRSRLEVPTERNIQRSS